MKHLFVLPLLLTLGITTSCNQHRSDDEITIERQEDYNREDASDTQVVPVERDEEIKLQSDQDVDVDD